MRIKQNNLPFRTITLVLENLSEAETLLGLVDNLDRFYSDDGATFTHDGFTQAEREIIVQLSNELHPMLDKYTEVKNVQK